MFKEWDQLSAYKIPNDERIKESTCVRDIARLGTVVIKRTGTTVNHEHAATHHKHGLPEVHAMPVKQDGIRLRGDLGGEYNSEIKCLNRKLKIESNLKFEGFVFEIVPKDYTYGYNEKESITTFYSEEERKEKQTKIRVIPNWYDWQPGEALPCWGVRINNNVSKDHPSRRSYQSKKETSKIPTVIVTKTCFYQVREFAVKVTINAQVVKEAKKILKVSNMQEGQNIIKKFNDKYCSFVYTGKFSAGAWLGTMVTARGVKYSAEQDLTTLKKLATEETDHHWSWQYQSGGSSSYQNRRNKDRSVSVSLITISDPHRIDKMCQLHKTIKKVENCAVFPANWDEKWHFTPVYEIMQRQAEATGDQELRKASDIFKKYMKGKTAFLFITQ